jgi:hypothetical protein
LAIVAEVSGLQRLGACHCHHWLPRRLSSFSQISKLPGSICQRQSLICTALIRQSYLHTRFHPIAALAPGSSFLAPGQSYRGYLQLPQLKARSCPSTPPLPIRHLKYNSMHHQFSAAKQTLPWQPPLIFSAINPLRIPQGILLNGSATTLPSCPT